MYALKSVDGYCTFDKPVCGTWNINYDDTDEIRYATKFSSEEAAEKFLDDYNQSALDEDCPGEYLKYRVVKV